MNFVSAQPAPFPSTAWGIKWSLLFLPLLLYPVYAAGQTPVSIGFPDSSLQYCVVRLPKVPNFRLTLPVSMQEIKKAAVAVAGVSLWAVTYEHLDEPMREVGLRYRTSVATSAANMVEPLGRQKYLAPLAGLAVISGLAAGNNKLTKAGLLSGTSVVANAVATHTLKRAFQRHRPSATDDNDLFDGPFERTNNRSFPSYHTSSAFAVASSFALVYHDHKYIPPIAYGLATLVGLSRIQHNAHWATDVLAGAAVGYLSAKGVNYLYELTSKKLNIRRNNLLILPAMHPAYVGFSTTIIF